MKLLLNFARRSARIKDQGAEILKLPNLKRYADYYRDNLVHVDLIKIEYEFLLQISVLVQPRKELLKVSKKL